MTSNKFQWSVIIIALIIIIGSLFIVLRHKASAPNIENTQTPVATTTPVSATGTDEIVVTAPLPNQVVSSPLVFSGKAKGSWFFEGSLPVTLLDEDGSILGNSVARAQGSWQTEDLVNFTGTLRFKAPKGKTGKLVFANDNPSGLPQNAKIFPVPVKF